MESRDQATEQLMFSLIEIWQTTDKSQQDFCKEKDIAYHKFSYWFRKYRAVQSATPTADTKFFKQIKMKEATAPACALELIFADGKKIIFHKPVEASFLRSLLQ